MSRRTLWEAGVSQPCSITVRLNIVLLAGRVDRADLQT